MSSAIEPLIEPAIVLAAYAEPVASGRRVLFVGPASSALPGRLLERGARVVLVCDPDPVRLAEATAKNRSSALSFSALGDGQLALRDGAFDVAIVEDAGITDPVALVKKLRRALAPRGVAILASINPETRVPLLPHRPSGAISLDYYALYDAVKAEFEHVRMLGQAPFVGYVVADFAPEGTPEPSLDTAFLPNGAEEPEIFVAVASQQPVDLESFAVVQLPYRSVVSAASGDGEALRRARSAEAATRAKLSEVEAELTVQRQAVAAHLAELQSERAAAATRQTELTTERQTAAPREAKLREAEIKLREAETKLRETQAKLGEAETKLRDGETKLREAETKPREADAKLREAEIKLRDSGAKLGEVETKLRDAETGVFARDAELSALRRELEQKNRLLEAQDSKLGELNHKLLQAPSAEEASGAAAELSALEKALTERGEHIRKLERELREAERIGKELLRQLPPADETPARARHESQVDLAQKLAKTQADLVATRWALEAAVKRGPSSDTPEA
jgi:SAM-dependent methyltransferase